MRLLHGVCDWPLLGLIMGTFILRWKNINLLPAFQVQVLICTGVSVSNLERALCIHILLVVNDLIRKIVRGVNAVMALRNLRLGKTIINSLACRSFATECFCVKYETLLLLRT